MAFYWGLVFLCFCSIPLSAKCAGVVLDYEDQEAKGCGCSSYENLILD